VGKAFAIASFINQYYIIQLDSDTLTLSTLDEVNDHIKTNTGFVISTWDKQEIEPMNVTSERAQKNNNHVQMLAEIHFFKTGG
jgi:hypothetical protein